MRTALVLVTSVTALLFAQSVHARSVDDTVVASVPFEFVAGDEVLPAGTYRVRVVPDDTSWTGLVVLQKAPGIGEQDDMIVQAVRTSVVDVSQAGPMEQPELMFSKVGNHYFLESITTG